MVKLPVASALTNKMPSVLFDERQQFRDFQLFYATPMEK